MKTLLITTATIGIATTAAFGAASLRAPQLGGEATTPAASAPTTARAGTLRAQTMKTSSVSAPTVTTTQSIATPVSTETMDARLSLLKGIKGFSPNKVKETSTATNQTLDQIDSRIEELQSKLDQAEAAQSSVITEANIDAKINEKITALGTSTNAKDTYSKTEINKLLPYKENGLIYLPVLPGQPGAGDIGDPTPTVIAPEIRFSNRGFDQSSDGLVTVHKYVTNASTNEIITFINNFCRDLNNGDEYWCSQHGQITLENSNTGERAFKILQRHHGYKYVTLHYPYGQYNEAVYTTNEHDSNGNPTAYINEHICGNANGTSTCFVSSYHENTGLDFAKYTVSISSPTMIVFQYLDSNFSDTAATHSIKYGTNASTEAIEDFAADTCGDRTERWCALVDVKDNPDYPENSQYSKTFRITSRDNLPSNYPEGFGEYVNSELIAHDGASYERVVISVHTDGGRSKARELALDVLGCNSPYYSGEAHTCYLTSLTDNCAGDRINGALPCNFNVQDHYTAVGIRNLEMLPSLPEPLQD